MDHPKILPNRMTNSITNWISGYQSSITLSIFIGTSQNKKIKAYISGHKTTSKIEIN